MAFDKHVFRTRALTAIIFAAVMLTGLLWDEWSFFILFSVIHFGCWWEFGKLVSLMQPQNQFLIQKNIIPVSILGWCLMLVPAASMLHLNAWSQQFSSGLTWIILFISVFILTTFVTLHTRRGFKVIWILLSGLAYISLPWILMVHLRSGAIWMPAGGSTHLLEDLAHIQAKTLPLILIASIWLNDTMAYLVGSFMGRRPLSRFSPKKTWEGTIGGIILSSLFVSLAGYFFMHGEIWIYASVSFIAAVSGTIGDLFESWLKRRAGVKDSGHFMPGHGGFLDRFDSMLAAVPFVWIFCILFMR